MRLTLFFTAALVFVPLLLLSGSTTSAVTMSESNSNDVHPHYNSGRQHSYKSDSTEQLSDDGHDEMRRLPETDNLETWEGSNEIHPATNKGIEVTRAQLIEAFGAFVVAVATAITSNFLTRYAIHELHELY